MGKKSNRKAQPFAARRSAEPRPSGVRENATRPGYRPDTPEQQDAPVTFEKSCGALVVRRDRTTGERYILMIRHRFGGYRSFPKGHTEPGETERETAAREVLEETAAHITFIPDFRQVVLYHPMPGTVKQVVYFLAQTDSAAIAPREGEIATVEWIPLEESMELLTHDNDRRILAAALHKLDSLAAPEHGQA